VGSVALAVSGPVGAVVGRELLEVREECHRAALALIRRCQRSSATVQPFCFTFNNRRVGPDSYSCPLPSRLGPHSRAR
jgi:hypothetical protein